MGHKGFILVGVALLVLVVGAVSVYAYDSSNEDEIANGVTVAGVPIGGRSTEEARAELQRKVVRPLEQPIAVTRGTRRFELSAQQAGLRVDLGAMVDQALARSRDGNMLSRALRDLTGSDEDAQVPVRVTYSKTAPADLVKRVSKAIDRPAQDARVSFPAVTPVKERNGLRVDAAKLESDVRSALTDPHKRTVEAPTSVTRPKVTRAQLAEKYPTLLVVQRGSFQLKLYKHLRFKKSYRIAVGQVGLETPAGLYHIENKGVNVPWNVPRAPWAGSLGGTTVPGGAPDNPLKARWLGIFAGAGIHGTDQLGSLGTAASHGCIRMAIPDVIELYGKVPVKTPIYIA
jgi:lipoprotein-anchoring transpeptidase ErfK/SrfK